MPQGVVRQDTVGCRIISGFDALARLLDRSRKRHRGGRCHGCARPSTPCHDERDNSQSSPAQATSSTTGGVRRNGVLRVTTARTGSVIAKVVPTPILLDTEMVPPWASTISLAIAKPKPVPRADDCAWLFA